MVLTAVLLMALSGTNEMVAEMGDCDPRSGPLSRWPKELREETRDRVKAACKHVGASPIVCAYADAVVVRESSGRAGVRHTLGRNEDGLGPMGLSLKWHANRWTGRADPDFCQPEISFAVAHSIMWSAVRKYGARTMLEVQAVYGGSVHCHINRDEKRVCRPLVRKRDVKSTCKRMRLRGFSCHERITRKDLGRRIRKVHRQDWAESIGWMSEEDRASQPIVLIGI